MFLKSFQDEIGDGEDRDYADWAEMKNDLEEIGYLKIFKMLSELLQEDDFIAPRGIHGFAHTKRVLMLVLCLCYKLQIRKEEMLLLAICALYHDVGRVDDSVDNGHGIASFRKARALLEETGYDMELMRCIIENHCIDDKTAYANISSYNLPDQVKAKRLLDIFKDADGLDRLRIHDLDPKYLRHDEARNLMMIAYQLLRELR